MKQKYRFEDKDEEEEYFRKQLHGKILKLKQNNYIKLPSYTIDLKGFYPYIDELKLNIFKFKRDNDLRARALLNKMKEKFIHSAKVRK